MNKMKNRATQKIPDWILRLDSEEFKHSLTFDVINIINEIPENYRFTSELIRKRILEIHDPPIYKSDSSNVRECLRRLKDRGLIKSDIEKRVQLGKNYIQYYREKMI